MILKDKKVKNKYLDMNKQERYEYKKYLFDHFVSDSNIYHSLKKVNKGKNKYRNDSNMFMKYITSNLAELKYDIIDGKYEPSGFICFTTCDRKRRKIEAPVFRDKLVQRMLFNVLIDIYEPLFISDSYACIRGKGTQRATLKIQEYMKEANKMYNDPYILKLDISKFYPSIDREILKGLIDKTIYDSRMKDFLYKMLDSYKEEKGLPLGNISSQIFSNVYMNVFDQQVKRVYKIKYYVRYADDMFFIVDGKDAAIELKNQSIEFLKNTLNLTVCYNKVNIVKNISIDALGLKVALDGIYLTKRSKDKFKQILKNSKDVAHSLNSWFGAKSLAKCFNFIYNNISKKINLIFTNKKFDTIC